MALPPPPPGAVEGAPAPSPEERVLQAEQREDDAIVRARAGQAEADAERRIREIEGLTAAAEEGAHEAGIGGEATAGPQSAEPADQPAGERLLDEELRRADELIDRRIQRDQELLGEIERTEMRIEEQRERTEQALADARTRLERIEAQAGEAEQRAARAEKLAELREQEAERERRLHEMLGRIHEAEQRAREAESRARDAVAGVSGPPDPGDAQPDSPPPPPAPAPEPDDSPTDFSEIATTREAGPAPGGVLPGSPADGEGELRAAPDFENEGAAETPGSGPVEEGDRISLNEANFEQLRDAGLSVTQTGRVLAHRERAGGFSSVDELEEIPGFPRDFLDQVKSKFRA